MYCNIRFFLMQKPSETFGYLGLSVIIFIIIDEYHCIFGNGNSLYSHLLRHCYIFLLLLTAPVHTFTVITLQTIFLKKVFDELMLKSNEVFTTIKTTIIVNKKSSRLIQIAHGPKN